MLIKKLILKRKWIISKSGTLYVVKKNFNGWQAYFLVFIGAGARAGEKILGAGAGQTDRLHNTANMDISRTCVASLTARTCSASSSSRTGRTVRWSRTDCRCHPRAKSAHVYFFMFNDGKIITEVTCCASREGPATGSRDESKSIKIYRWQYHRSSY